MDKKAFQKLQDLFLQNIKRGLLEHVLEAILTMKDKSNKLKINSDTYQKLVLVIMKDKYNEVIKKQALKLINMISDSEMLETVCEELLSAVKEGKTLRASLLKILSNFLFKSDERAFSFES